MARNIKVKNVKDFRGGINLRGDGFELAENESPDLLNVDIDARGGIQSRGGVHLQAHTAWGNPNHFTANASTYLDSVDNTGVTMSNHTAVRSTAAPLPTVGLFGRPIAPAFRRCTIPGATQAYLSGGFAVTALQRVSIGANFRSVSGSLHQVAVRLDWYASNGGAFISSTISATPALTTAWQFLSIQGAAAPAGALWCIPIFWIAYTAASAGSVVDLHGMHVAQGYNPYWFDQNNLVLPGEITCWGRYIRAGVDQLYGVAGNTIVYCNAAVPGVWYILMGQYSADAWFVQFKDQLYFGEQNQLTRQYDGYTLTDMGALVYNDNLAAPLNNRFPIMGRSTPVVFQGVVFCAVGQDPSGTVQQNRLRWSHPNSAGDWRSFDYIDIDTGVDGDIITALVPFQDKLLIFKKHSVYALSGTSPDTFQVYPISRRVGAVDQRAVSLTEAGVYFYDEREGVFMFDGKGIRWQFERIHPLITRDLIARAEVKRVRLGWTGRRLWVSVPWRESVAVAAPVNNTRVFVLDPTLSKEGSWTQYDNGAVGTMYELVLVGQAVRLLGARNYLGRYYILENPGAAPLPYDTVAGAGGVGDDVQKHITSYYVSAWHYIDQPSLAKRWLKPELVIRSVNAESSLVVDVRRDFDSRITRRSFTLITKPDDAEMVWGDPWGQIWAGAVGVSPASVIMKGPRLGKAKAVQLKVNGPPTNHHWGLNTITLKFTPLPPRS